MFQGIPILNVHPACGAHGILAHTRWLGIWLSSVGASHPAPRRTPLCSKPRCTVDQLAVPPEFLGFWLSSDVIRVELLMLRTCSGSGKIPDMCVLCESMGGGGGKGGAVCFHCSVNFLKQSSLPTFNRGRKIPK